MYRDTCWFHKRTKTSEGRLQEWNQGRFKTKLTIVAIVGVDEVGKTTLISQLKEKYNVDVLAFPTPRLREELSKLSIDYTDIHSILNYHMRFQLDFNEQQKKLANYKYNKRLLILDRYFYCSLAYLRHAVLQHYLEDYWKYIIRPILYAHCQVNLINPDYIIWLRHGDMNDEIQRCYYEELYDWDDYNGDSIEYESVVGRLPNTFKTTEDILKEKGFL